MINEKKFNKVLKQYNKDINYTNNLIKYLCSTEEEIEEYNKIYSKYNSAWDRMTEYRKSRIRRSVF